MTTRRSPGPEVSEHAGWRWLLVEAARPAAVRSSPWAPWLLVGTVCVGAFMGQLDASIVTLALPTLRSDFHSSLGAVEWVTLSYLVVLVGAVTIIGRLADITGRKLLYLYGFGLFTIGSVLCGLSPSLLVLDGSRVLQGVGAALLQANSVALITHGVPREKLGQAIGIQGGAQAVGLALGPVVGGALIGVGGWRLIFFVNVPAGIIGFALGWFLLPRTVDKTRGERFDWLGALLVLPAVGTLMAALSFGRELGWISPPIVGLAILAAVLGVGFLVRERSARHPLVRLALFRIHPFSAGLASGLLSYLVTFGVLLAVPFFLVAGHATPGVAGLELAALPVALGVVAPLAGRVADAVGARPVTVAGMLVAAACLVMLAVAHASTLALILELAGIGAGLGAFTPANNAAIMGSVPRSRAGVAGGILNMTRGLGTSLGITLTGLVYSLGANADRGLLYAGLFLAAVSVISAVIASLRGPVAIDRRGLASVE